MDKHVPMPLFKAIPYLDVVQVVNSDNSCLLPLHFPNKACWKASSDWHIILAVNVCSLSRHKRYTILNPQLSKPSSLCKLPGNLQRNSRLIKFLQPPGPFSFSGPNVHLIAPSSNISNSSRPEHTPTLRPSVFRSFEFGKWCKVSAQFADKIFVLKVTKAHVLEYCTNFNPQHIYKPRAKHFYVFPFGRETNFHIQTY
jgi:hypothetical protein